MRITRNARGRIRLPMLLGWLREPFSTLSTRIAVPAGFFALVSVGLLSFILIRAQREQVLAEAVHGSESIAEAILLSLDHDMRVNRREGVREMLEAVARHEGIERIRILNKDGRISYASRPEEVGRAIDMQAEACVQCHQGADSPARELRPNDRSRIYRNADGNRVLATVDVIRNRPDCQGSACHVPVAEQSVLGVLDVAISLAPASARLAAATRDAVVISLIAVVLITATLIIVIRRSVRRPLGLMVAATRRIAAGETSLPIPPGSAPEIGILATSFNEMIESLASSKEELAEWANSLEEKVASKAEELRQARAQVVQAERLSSVGLVAAGIAHELNSPLMGIITFANLVKSTLPADSQAREDVRTIEREANRCALIIRQLLDFSRKQTQDPQPYPCRLKPVLAGALELLKIEVQNARAEVKLEISDELPEVEANEVQLMQVFVNLVLNALQAMPNGGTLRISADVVPRAAFSRRDLPPHPSSSLVRIRVEDTGTGIPAADLTRVFDPFFTTKPLGKGSGLGLSVSLGLVQGYHGTIIADSDGRSWTRLTVLLPVAEHAALVPT
jgi:two-component system NtrC family sensor kinase